jgi:hypothetical protein
MASNLKTTELDFDDIKRNLKNFLKRQTVFNDYDFDGSGLNVLLDVLAYNTHYNAMAGHLALNEAFLDSAQIRGNAVSRARMLGYVPSSRLSPRAAVTIVIDVTGVAGAKPTNLALPRGTKLSTSVDGETYQFVTLNTQSATIVGNTYTYTNVAIAEGNYNSIKYRVDNDIENQKHQIPHKNVDTSTLRTRVQANEESTSFDIFTLFTTLLNIDSSSKVYHLQENTSGFYEVYFGDGVTGTKPLNNNVVTLDYVYSNGTEANGASVFSMVDNIGGFSNVTVTTVTTAAGGSEGETLESIRYNAPLTYTSQNRAVTADDYRAIIQREFANIDAISTWGGEDQATPDYGKIFIAIKPKTADTLTDDEKATVTGTVLAGKNVVSITPTVVDPNYSYVELDVAFKYNPNLTDRTDIELKSVVSDVIDDYSLNDLNKFDGVFRHSALLRNIDSSDPSILNSTVRPFLFKNITPLITISNNFSLVYPGSFYVPGGATDTCIQSTAFKIGGVDNYFNDVAIPGSANRKIFAYRLVGAEKVVTISDCGVVNPTEGTITLNSFIPDTTDSIRISVTPESLDIAPKRDEILSIDSTRTTMSADKDTIATSGSSGSINYTTTSRFRSST